jgi:nuclear mRNA export protein SAC3
MNPSTDATAIWLERKFDVPESGQWNAENIFSIPLLPGRGSPISPGVIIFECTPLEGVTDEIERSFRIT